MRSVWEDARREVISVCEQIFRAGLVSGSSGNVSKRISKDQIAITPTSVPYARLRAEDILIIDYEGDPLDSDGVPSSEKLLHLAIYRSHANVGGVVHTH